MWVPKKIDIENICAFHNASYKFINNVATLISGENLDNTSQKSNGSGKSALNEAIAFCIIGSPLRRVKDAEIINNEKQSAKTKLELYNSATNETMLIDRSVFRKGPQKISVEINGSPIDKASLSDYNQYILETLGLTKDEIYGSFILSKVRFNDFLVASDKEKKEIINRFSRANLIDQSIKALSDDIDPIKKAVQDKTLEISNYEGRIQALTEQVENEKIKEKDKEKAKEDRISDLRDQLKKYSESIDLFQVQKTELENLLAQINLYLEEITIYEERKFEDDDFSIIKSKISGKANTLFGLAISNLSDNEIINEIDKYENEIQRYLKTKSDLEKEKLNQDCVKKIIECRIDEFNVSKKKEGYQKVIEQSQSNIKDCPNQIKLLSSEIKEKQVTINKLDTSLKSSISCPNCKHEFVASEKDFNCEAAKIEISKLTENIVNIKKLISEIELLVEQENKLIHNAKYELDKIEKYENKLHSQLVSAKQQIASTESSIELIETKIEANNSKIDLANRKLKNLKENLMNEVYDQVESFESQKKNSLELLNNKLVNTQGAIKSTKEMIDSLVNEPIKDYLAAINSSIEEFTQKIFKAKNEFDGLSASLEKHQSQIQRFIAFKTYMANSKIDALSAITNEFLEEIGSDLRIRFEGYTMLKSGDVRDKINIAILRDGIDIGSIGKLSVGETSRIQLATILAMNKLVNLNADGNKGLDLLIIDEVLDGVDEPGLFNTLNSLNKIGITSLMISHGKTAESYKHRLVIQKKNGVSKIHE